MLVTVSPWKQMIALDSWMFPIYKAGLATSFCDILDNVIAHLRAPAPSLRLTQEANPGASWAAGYDLPLVLRISL